MRILVIGAGGFVGRALCQRLFNQGHQVIGLSRSMRPETTVNRWSQVQATLDDHQVLQRALDQVDQVFHLAWDTTPGTSASQPSLEVSNNLLPSMRLLEAMQERRGLPLIFMSSGGALFRGDGNKALHEDMPLQPRSYYGAGKVAMEAFLQAFAQRNDSPVVLLRASNLYGPGQRAKRQFAIVPTLFDCLKRKRPFEIWGDGSAVRDFLFIEDFLDCCERLLDWSAPAAKTTAFNLGSGTGTSINALCDHVESVSGLKLERDYRPERGVDNGFVTMDTRRVGEQLGWQASTTLDAGLRQTWAWIRDFE